jgi:hypothetical protein
LDNEFRLQFPSSDDDKQIPNPLSGQAFKSLQLNLQERIEDTQLTLYVLDSKAPERAKLDIFERVNSGEPLTRQQMRNCLYNGVATRWLKAAADSNSLSVATTERAAANQGCLHWPKTNEALVLAPLRSSRISLLSSTGLVTLDI